MPIVNEFRKSVIFIGTKRENIFRPAATAFIVSVTESECIVSNLVTAEHVVRGIMDSGLSLWLRFNTKSGAFAEEEVPFDAWFSHPENAHAATDVAVAIFNPRENADVVPIPLIGPDARNATLSTFTNTSIGLGDEVFLVGLFRNHYGAQQNRPIIRVGNLSAISEEPVHTRYCGPTQAHLIEARSISGLSGSPVFLRSQPVEMFGGELRTNNAHPIYLLGLMHGHFDVQNMHEDVVVDDRDGGGSINIGMGVVIPVEKILETVDQPRLRTLRAEAIAKYIDQKKTDGVRRDDQ